MVEVEARVAEIRCVKLSGVAEEGSEITFDVNASLRETGRNPGVLALDFDIAFTTQPMVAKILLAGSATIRGKDEDIQDLITLSQDSAPDIFMKIYEKLYAVLYLLSGTIAIPYPTPGLIKKTRLYPNKGATQPLEVMAR